MPWPPLGSNDSRLLQQPDDVALDTPMGPPRLCAATAPSVEGSGLLADRLELLDCLAEVVERPSCDELICAEVEDLRRCVHGVAFLRENVCGPHLLRHNRRPPVSLTPQ